MNVKKISIIRYVLVFATTALLLSSLIPIISGDSPFSVNTQVSKDLLDKNQMDSVLAVDSAGNLYVAWEDGRNSDLDIYFAGSTDNGATWTDPNVRVNSGGSGTVQDDTAIAATNTHIFVAWADMRSGTDYDIYFANSTDGGATWSNPNVKVNTEDVGTTTQNTPALAVDSNGVVYMVWQDYRDTSTSHSDIFFARSSDGGATWTHPNVRVNQDATTTTQRDPTIAVDSQGNIYVAWEDQITGDYDINFSMSDDGGATWSDPSIRINSDETTEDQRNPNIAVDAEDNIYVTWEDKRNGDWDIYFARSVDGGNIWTHPNKRVDSDDTNTGQHNPVIAVGLNNIIYVTWHDNRNVDYDIYYAESDDGGNSWTPINKRVNDDIAGKSQLSPSIAVDSTVTVYIVWHDDRNGNSNYDIYFSSLESKPAPPTADGLGVDGFLEGSDGIDHIITDLPAFNFTYNDFSGNTLESYNISVWDAAGSNMLWDYNTTDSSPSGSNIEVTYNTAPAPTGGPSLDDGTTYKLRVMVANATGVWSAQSEVDFHINEVLTPDTPVSPQDDTLIATSNSLTVSWTSPGADSEGDTPVTYSWEVAMDSTFTDIIASGSGAATESSSFDAGSNGTYYWRVDLSDGYETGTYGNQPDGFWNFTTYTGSSTTNNDPDITNKASAPSTATVNTTLSFTFTATDADSDSLTWTMVTGVSWLDIGPTNGTLYGTPSSQDTGSNEITIQVADGNGGTDGHTFTLTVSETSDGNGDGDQDGDSEFPWLWIIIIIVIIIIVILVIFSRRI